MGVLIAGAGIGGLTAALTLHANGIEATVVERVRDPKPLGVGINVLPHAVRELEELGLGDRLPDIGVATAEHVYVNERGERLFVEPRGLAGGYGSPQYSVHRGKLQMLLLEVVRERLGEDAVRTGSRLLGFEQDADEVRVRTPDGMLTGDALIAADGVHSAVRAALHPGEGPLQWSGTRMWRGVTETRPFFEGRSAVLVRGRSAEMIVYPIGPDSLNWVVLAREAGPGPLPGDAGWNTPGDLADVLALVGDWDLGWLDVPWLVSNSEALLEYPMVDRDPLPHWGTGRVTLLGDAAHPMYPVGANGASQSIVDARVLADELARDLPGGLAAYEKIRREATASVVAANREMHAALDARSAADLAATTAAYRRQTAADG